MRFIGGAIGHQTVPIQQKLMAELLPEDSDSDSGDEGSVVEMEDFEESTDFDIELEEEDADNDDDNLDEWLSDHSEDDNESRDSDSLDERSDTASEELEPIQLESW